MLSSALLSFPPAWLLVSPVAYFDLLLYCTQIHIFSSSLPCHLDLIFYILKRMVTPSILLEWLILLTVHLFVLLIIYSCVNSSTIKKTDVVWKLRSFSPVVISRHWRNLLPPSWGFLSYLKRKTSRFSAPAMHICEAVSRRISGDSNVCVELLW